MEQKIYLALLLITSSILPVETAAEDPTTPAAALPTPALPTPAPVSVGHEVIDIQDNEDGSRVINVQGDTLLKPADTKLNTAAVSNGEKQAEMAHDVIDNILQTTNNLSNQKTKKRNSKKRRRNKAKRVKKGRSKVTPAPAAVPGVDHILGSISLLSPSLSGIAGKVSGNGLGDVASKSSGKSQRRNRGRRGRGRGGGRRVGVRRSNNKQEKEHETFSFTR